MASTMNRETLQRTLHPGSDLLLLGVGRGERQQLLQAPPDDPNRYPDHDQDQGDHQARIDIGNDVSKGSSFQEDRSRARDRHHPAQKTVDHPALGFHFQKR